MSTISSIDWFTSKFCPDLLEKLNQNLGKIESQLEWTRGRIQAVIREQRNRRNIAYLSVANNLKKILKEDLFRQAEFARAEEIDIDFAANQLSVDGQKQFSASSRTCLAMRERSAKAEPCSSRQFGALRITAKPAVSDCEE